MKITARLIKLTGLMLGTVAMGLLGSNAPAAAASIGFADVVLEFFDSGAGPIAGPYGGTFPGTSPIPVSTDVVLGDDPGTPVDFLSLPTGSFVTVGFTDETIIDGVGNDIFIEEVGSGLELANVFVSANLVDFVLLGQADGDQVTSFDLASIGFTEAVQALRIEGLDSGGSSPGFDLVNVQVLPASIGPAPTPVPTPALLPGLVGFCATIIRKRKLTSSARV